MVSYTAFSLFVLCSYVRPHDTADTGPLSCEPPNKKVKVDHTGCTLNWDNTIPIILYKSNKKIILPDKCSNSKTLTINSGRAVTISCPKSSLKNLNVLSISAECKKVNDGKLLYSNKALDKVECSPEIKDSIKKLPKTSSCKAQLYGIGFETHGNVFYAQIKVCFDVIKENTLWTEHTIPGENYPPRLRIDRKGSWSHDNLFTVKLEQIYYSQHQQDLFIAELGQGVKAPQRFIARGHMSPNADFVTAPGRKATFHYINALPQWQAVNNGNWKRVEESVQKLAAIRGTDIKIISGGHGILTLENTQKQLIDIYLGNYDNGPNKVPVPELTWKIVIDGAKKQGVAFVVINNPILESEPKPICSVTDSKGKDICGQLSWLVTNFNSDTRGKIDKGYTYCCTVSTLVTAIKTLPQQNVRSLLV